MAIESERDQIIKVFIDMYEKKAYEQFCIDKIEVLLNNISVGSLKHYLKAAFKINFWIASEGCNIVLYAPPYVNNIPKNRRDLTCVSKVSLMYYS